MQSPDDKQHGDLTTPRSDSGGEALPGVWRKLLASAAAGAPYEQGVLGFFLEVMPEEGMPYAHLDVAPVLLSVAEQGGRFVRPVPLDSRHLAQSTAAAARAAPGRYRARPAAEPAQESQLCAAVAATSATRCWRRFSTPRRVSWAAWPACACRAANRINSTGTGTWSRTAASGCCLRCRTVIACCASMACGTWMPSAPTLGHLEAPLEETQWLDLPPLKHEHGRSLRDALPRSRLATRLPLPQVLGEMRRAATGAQAGADPACTHPPCPPGRRYAAAGLMRGWPSTTPASACPAAAASRLVRRVRNGQLVEITRRRAEELSAMEQLERAGLTPGVDTEGLPWDVADTLPEDAWLFPRQRLRRRAGSEHAGALAGAAAEA